MTDIQTDIQTDTEIDTRIDTEIRFQCRHIHFSGLRCGSPTLRNQPFCYHHHTTRRPLSGKPIAHCGHHSEFDLALPEDRSAIQLNIGEVLRRIAANQIDPRRAGLLLYGLQIAAMTLPREDRRNPARHSPAHRAGLDADQHVHEVIFDDTLGPVAPPAQLTGTTKSSTYMRDLVLQFFNENYYQPDPNTPDPGTPTPRYPDIPNPEDTTPQDPATTETISLQACQAPSSDLTAAAAARPSPPMPQPHPGTGRPSARRREPSLPRRLHPHDSVPSDDIPASRKPHAPSNRCPAPARRRRAPRPRPIPGSTTRHRAHRRDPR